MLNSIKAIAVACLLAFSVVGCVEVRVVIPSTPTPAPASPTIATATTIPPTPVPSATSTATARPSPTLVRPTTTRVVTAQPTAQPTATALPPCAIQTSPDLVDRWTYLRPQIGCPTEAAREVAFAFEQFENGTMLWRADNRRIYVLIYGENWVSFDDTWNSTLPEDSCPNIVVGAGHTKPYHGFGKVWCEQANIRTKIGDGTASEIGPNTRTLQVFEHGTIFIHPVWTWYVYSLFSNGEWD